MLKAVARNYELELKYIQINSTSEISSLYEKFYSRILPHSEPPCSLNVVVPVCVLVAQSVQLFATTWTVISRLLCPWN